MVEERQIDVLTAPPVHHMYRDCDWVTLLCCARHEVTTKCVELAEDAAESGVQHWQNPDISPNFGEIVDTMRWKCLARGCWGLLNLAEIGLVLAGDL